MSVDLSGSIMRRIRRAVALAEEQEQAGELRSAAARYREAAELHEKMAAYSVSQAGTNNELALAAAFRRRAEEMLAADRALSSGASPAGTGPSGSRPTLRSAKGPLAARRRGWDSEVEEGVPGTEGLRRHVQSLIQRSPVRWEDIGGLTPTKQRLQMALSLMLAKAPEGVKLPRSRLLLLEGPPGTGKTLLAAAVAGHLGATFFNVKVSQLGSRYYGDSPRLVSLLFEEARAKAPSVIFLDEFEALASSRSGDDSGVERRVLSTLLAELDGLDAKGDSPPVLTLAATNVPELLDEAVRSRFSYRIVVPLPDAEARAEIFKIHIEQQGFGSKVPVDSLVRRSEGYSGRDIWQLCTLAKENMLLRANPRLTAIGQPAGQDGNTDTHPRKPVEAELTIDQLAPEDFEKALALMRVPGGSRP